MLSQTGSGSIHALLRRHGWGERIACSVAETNSHFSLFEIEIALTPDGRQKVIDMVGVVFQAIQLIRDEGIQGRYFDEVRASRTLIPGQSSPAGAEGRREGGAAGGASHRLGQEHALLRLAAARGHPLGIRLPAWKDRCVPRAADARESQVS